MKTILTMVVLILGACVLSAGRVVASGHDRLEAIRSVLNAARPDNGANENLIDGKCGFRLSSAILDSRERLTPAQQQQLRELMSPAAYQQVRLTQHFEIHYDTSGENQPALLDAGGHRIANTYEQYVDSVAKYFERAWSVEVDSLHFLPPPIPPGRAGYEIDIREYNGQVYGQTWFLDQINPGASPSRYYTYIDLDNDFLGYYSEGMAGLRVTSAHEFNHSIQIGSYAYWGTQYAYYYEITSTWLEDLLNDDVNDYYNYLRTPSGSPRGTFQTPEVSLTRSNGLIEYSRAIWGKYIQERYSSAMMVAMWNEIAHEPILPALNKVLTDSGSSFGKAFLEWSLWNYHTGRRADPVHFYREGAEYPAVNERDTLFYFSPSGFYQDSLQSLGSVYHPISIRNHGAIYSIVSNINASTIDFSTWHRFTYRVADSTDGTYKRLDSIAYVKIDVGDPEHWRSQESVPGVDPVGDQDREVFVYPNPFYFPMTSGITFLLPGGGTDPAHLLVLSSSMRQIYEGDVPIQTDISGRPAIVWNADENEPGSGVYIFVIELGARRFTGKFTIIKR